jgi:hypothetical protein
MKEKIKIICLILITIVMMIAVWRYWVYTNDYHRLVNFETEFEVKNYAE